MIIEVTYQNNEKKNRGVWMCVTWESLDLSRKLVHSCEHSRIRVKLIKKTQKNLVYEIKLLKKGGCWEGCVLHALWWQLIELLGDIKGVFATMLKKERVLSAVKRTFKKKKRRGLIAVSVLFQVWDYINKTVVL